MGDHDLSGFERDTVTSAGRARTVFRAGSGPAVIVLAELPGITPAVLGFAERVAAIGCTAVVSHLFGTSGRDADPAAHGRLGTAVHLVRTMVPLCVSREFTLFATGRTSPVVAWLRELAAHEHARCGGPGVGVVGMCLTGGFALAMAVDDTVIAPVLSQPSLPTPVTPAARRTIDLSPADLAAVKRRCSAGELSVLGLRFAGDRISPPERFAFLRRELGDAFTAVELPDSAANPDAMLSPHSVLTEHLIDRPGEPTLAAVETVLDLFRAKLLTA